MNPEARRIQLGIEKMQREWAETRSRGVRDSAADPKTTAWGNLRRPLDGTGLQQITSGDGEELKEGGKMAVPHSSSALGVNVFDYWRADPQTIGSTIRAKSGLADRATLCAGVPAEPFSSICYEDKFLTGAGSRPANIDVVFRDRAPGAPPSLLGIESKFVEPFRDGAKLLDATTGQRWATYLEAKRERIQKGWSRLSGSFKFAQELAYEAQKAKEAEKRDPDFVYLDVRQLLKHALGLARAKRPALVGSHAEIHDFELVLLWYEPPGDFDECKVLRDEIDRFKRRVEGGFKFGALTYQELFAALPPRDSRDAEYNAYHEYLGKRYFPTM